MSSHVPRFAKVTQCARVHLMYFHTLVLKSTFGKVFENVLAFTSLQVRNANTITSGVLVFHDIQNMIVQIFPIMPFKVFDDASIYWLNHRRRIFGKKNKFDVVQLWISSIVHPCIAQKQQNLPPLSVHTAVKVLEPVSEDNRNPPSLRFAFYHTGRFGLSAPLRTRGFSLLALSMRSSLR